MLGINGRISTILSFLAVGCGPSTQDNSAIMEAFAHEAKQVLAVRPLPKLRHRALDRDVAKERLNGPHPAVKAAPQWEAPWWAAEVLRLGAEVEARPDARLLFVGDSITWGFPVFAPEIWGERYAPRRALNLGIIGDQTQHVLWRLRHGNLETLRPRAVVLMLGLNNALEPTHRPLDIAAGVEAVLDELRHRLPGAQILLLGILPANAQPSPLRDKIAAANALLAPLAAERAAVRFVDIGELFVDDDGVLPAEVAFDEVHLTARGYAIWAEAIEPHLRQMLDEG